MKNKILKTMFLGCGVFALTACSDFLDTKSPSRNEASDVFENTAPIGLAINGIYADLCGETYTQLMTIHQGAGTDVELIDGLGATATSANERGAMNYNATAGAWAKLETLWEEQYNTILDCNRIIDGIRNSKLFNERSDDDAEKILAGKYLSEALTIRAMVYLDLVRVFGDIPMMLHDSDPNLTNVNVGKTDRDVILDQMIEDLEWVVGKGYLPWVGQVTSEHVNMGYAEALLANIYMTRAGYAIREAGDQAAGQPYSVDAKLAAGYVKADYSDDVYQTLRPSDEARKEYYTKAKEHLKNVIDKGIHRMNPSFKDEWYRINQLQLDQTYYENMFEIAMGIGNSGELGYTVGVRLNDKNKGKYKITDYGYTNSSGKLKTTAVQLYSYAAHDQRRDVTCVNYEIVDIDRSATVEGGTWTTAETFLSNKPFELYIGKWDVRIMSDRWKEQNRNANAKSGYGINVVRMRYPQVLLWYAECLNELDGPTDEAKKYLKAVHARAYYGDEGNTELAVFNSYIDAISDKDAFLDAISEENKLEFCGEGFRKWDLIRWNKLHEVIWMAKINYYQWRKMPYFPEKIYWKYTDDSEKEIDDASITWYGENGKWNGIFGINTASKVVEIGAGDKDWLENNGYRSPKGILYPALGIGSKGLNACSYNKGAFGQEPSNLNVTLPSICSGLVGTQMPKATDKSESDCKDEGVTVKNRYLMPLHSNVVNASNGRLKNSYGY